MTSESALRCVNAVAWVVVTRTEGGENGWCLGDARPKCAIFLTMTHPPLRSSVWKDLDRLLRGEATTLAALTRGDIEIEAARLPPLLIGLGAFYGICMGCFALTNKEFSSALLQTISSMGKVPVLFFATLVVSFPSLYVFNALVGSRLSLAALWRLLVSSLAVMMTVLASLGPVVAFFSLSTDNYPFIVLLNVAVFGISGFLGLKFLVGTLHRLTSILYNREATFESVQNAIESQNTTRDLGPLDRIAHPTSRSVKQVFALWVVAFALVGMQMSWVLRPFIASPGKPFTFISPRHSNFYAAVFNQLSSVWTYKPKAKPGTTTPDATGAEDDYSR